MEEISHAERCREFDSHLRTREDGDVAVLQVECETLRAELSRLTLSAAESQREVERLRERAKGFAVLTQSVSQRISTVTVSENESDGARSAIFDIGCYIATFGDIPESILDADEIERLKSKVADLDALAYNNGEAYNAQYLAREKAEADRDKYKAALETLMVRSCCKPCDACFKTLTEVLSP